MRFLPIFLVVIAACQANEEWEKFKLDYEKIYANALEERTRFAIFQKNLKEIEEHNELFRNGLVSWEKGITEFADCTKEEFLTKLRSRSNEKLSLYEVPFIPKEDTQAPVRINWKAKGRVSRVKRQGGCDAPWSFATAGALESQLLIIGKNVTLSEQQMVDCAKENQGCDIGWLEQAFDYVKENGLESDTAYPYVGEEGDCNYNKTKAVYKFSSYTTAKGENFIRYLVGNQGPAAAGIDASHFYNYKSGILDAEKCTPFANHFLLIVGYDSENGTDYWLAKNSWGTKWGEEGYIRIARGKDLCGIGRKAWVPVL